MSDLITGKNLFAGQPAVPGQAWGHPEALRELLPFTSQGTVAHDMELPTQIGEGGEPRDEPAEIFLRLQSADEEPTERLRRWLARRRDEVGGINAVGDDAHGQRIGGDGALLQGEGVGDHGAGGFQHATASGGEQAMDAVEAGFGAGHIAAAQGNDVGDARAPRAPPRNGTAGDRKERDHAVDAFAAQDASDTEARTHGKGRHLERGARVPAPSTCGHFDERDARGRRGGVSVPETSGEDDGVMPQLYQGAGKFPRGIGGAATDGRKLVVNPRFRS